MTGSRPWRALVLLAALQCWTGCPQQETPAAKKAASAAQQPPSWRGAATKAALIAKAIEAIRANDPQAYSALIPSVTEMKGICPKRFEGHSLAQIHKRREATTRKLAGNLARCATLVDWERAQQQEVWGGIVQPELPGCEPKLQRLGDITVSFTVDSARYEVILENPFVLGQKNHGLLRAPTCDKAD